MSKKSIIVLIIIILASIAIIATGITYAVWSQNPYAEEDVDVNIDDYNPSEKYIVFHALDESGAFCSDANAVSYAVVGYSGLVGELVIPDTHLDKPVTKICVSTVSDEYTYRLCGNPVVTSMIIPASVTEITAGACANMSVLHSVIIKGTDPITISEYAFGNCMYLEEITTERTILGDGYLF